MQQKYQTWMDETGCILHEKMMPDVTIMVLELEVGKQIIENHDFKGQLRWNKKLPDLAPPNCPIPSVFSNFGGKPLPANFFEDFTPVLVLVDRKQCNACLL
jgi:hypothetical protein